MGVWNFQHELQHFGPWAEYRSPSLNSAHAYCRRLAQSHYENFTVGSWLLPRRLRRHFYSVYAYCRWADDLADEVEDDAHSLTLLDWWEEQLEKCYQGGSHHPVFIALEETISRFAIPIKPFRDLLIAMRQDQRIRRYESFEELMEYCRRSANPVGRLVLYLGECSREENFAMSDAICTGLQLANFWQDVARDFDRGRLYLPQETLRRFGCEESVFLSNRLGQTVDGEDDRNAEARAALRRVIAFEVDRAETILLSGAPLVGQVPRWLRVDISLFIYGGQAILDSIRKIDYDVYSQRPTVGKTTKFRLFMKAMLAPPRKPKAQTNGN